MKPSILNTLVFQPLTLLVGVLLFGLNACVWEKGELPAPSTAEQCDTATYTFTNDIAIIFATSCATGSCHVGPTPMVGLDFSSYQVVKDKIEDGRIPARALDGSPNTMPPSVPGAPPLFDAATIAKINQWISEGMCE
ncbi:MAG TPA: hypothetical protein EYN69_09970 [Flavobacteriales bacterium]|nr:hypothetical protein [Flavobacteriales bacterium]